MALSREIVWRIKKPLRTVQSYFPFIKESKDDFYRSWRRIRRIPSEPFFAAIALIGGALKGTYIDVGGNTGQSIDSIRLYVPDAKVISFEPNPGLAAVMKARFRNDPGVTIRDIGLSDQPGRFQLHVPSYLGWVYDGLGSLDLEGARSWLSSETIYFFNPKKLTVQSFDCAVETLDMQDISDAIFIKIDVEGTEYEVLKGGIETLKNEPVLLIEGVNEKPELQKLVTDLGYRPYRFANGGLLPGVSANSTFLFTDRRMDAVTDALAGPRAAC